MLMGASGGARAQDKSGYSLFNPTPDGQLREMTTDRPDTTESPFTVDAGRVQIETTVFGYARSRPDADGAVSDSYEFATTNVRVGLTERVEVDVVWQPYGVVRTHQPGLPALRQSGIGGLDLRAKVNLWGNDTFDKTRTAVGLLPYVSLPTDRDNGISPEYVESGLIVPVALKLTDKLGLGLNGGVSWLRSDPTRSYHAEYLASASFAYEWTEKLGTYYEIAARFNVDDPCCGDAVVLGTGLTYALADNLQFDAGVNVGLTSVTDRINPFVGLSRRF
jgi:hypothetical protein